MDIVRLMGKEVREYTDKSTGEVKRFAGLHVVYESEISDVQGKKCESFSCPREVDVNDLQLGNCYELEYAHFNTKNGLAARICGLKLFEVE